MTMRSQKISQTNRGELGTHAKQDKLRVLAPESLTSKSE